MSTTIDMSWQQVTTNAEGGALAHPIANYLIEYFEGENVPDNIQGFNASPNATTLQLNNLTDGPLGVRILAVDTEGNQSEPSEWVLGDTTGGSGSNPDPIVPPATPEGFTATFTAV